MVPAPTRETPPYCSFYGALCENHLACGDRLIAARSGHGGHAASHRLRGGIMRAKRADIMAGVRSGDGDQCRQYADDPADQRAGDSELAELQHQRRWTRDLQTTQWFGDCTQSNLSVESQPDFRPPDGKRAD